ncbi:MAG TPA: hypothetical protein VFI29_14410 [Hanamia sp.]|nr:hypothetical protein [Hanamia sp.]
MESNDVFIYSIIALIIWAVIIYNIIQSASKSNKIELQLKMQTLLLAKMAQKAGVSDEDINKIINLKQ